MSDPINASPVSNPTLYPPIEDGPPKPGAATGKPSVVLDAVITGMKPYGAALAAYASMFTASPTKANVDAFYASANPTLTLKGEGGTTQPITIALPFRMSTNDPSPADAKKAILFELPPAVAAKLGPAIDMVVWGRGSPEQCAQVAQALLDVAGVPTIGSSPQTVRRYLEQYGVGIDCAGYAQQSAMKAVGLDPMKPADRVKFGFAPYIGNESMAGVATSSKFTKVAPEDAKPGDVVSLGAPAYETVGHSLVVASNRDVGETQRAALIGRETSKITPDPAKIAFLSGKLHTIEVDSSWGGKVGVARNTWLYDETTKKWATLDKGTGEIVLSRDPNGPYDHPLKGFFRSKLAP